VVAFERLLNAILFFGKGNNTFTFGPAGRIGRRTGFMLAPGSIIKPASFLLPAVCCASLLVCSSDLPVTKTLGAEAGPADDFASRIRLPLLLPLIQFVMFGGSTLSPCLLLVVLMNGGGEVASSSSDCSPLAKPLRGSHIGNTGRLLSVVGWWIL